MKTMKTSGTDVDSYKNICELFVSDDDKFRTFRNSSHAYNWVLEHVTFPLGQKYLEEILSGGERPAALFEWARKNDMVGSPKVHNYGRYGVFSPTTLRYLKVLTDIEESFDINEDTRIVEIGGGYGGQCRLIKDYFKVKNYSMIDLPVVLKLQEKYLKRFDINDVHYYEKPEDFDGQIIDLVISNFAFNELAPSVQWDYFEHIVSRAKMGYISGRWLGGSAKGCAHAVLKKRMNATVKSYTPLTTNNNVNIIWGNKKNN